KGFTEALITDLRINAPHIKCSVVMPGQIGTSIRANTRKIHSGDRDSAAIDAAGLAQARERFALLGRDVSQLSDNQVRNLVAELERRFRDEALTSAAQAATIILDGVKADRWRILVGADAHKVDEMVRQSPERAYDIAFFDEFARAAGGTDTLSLEPGNGVTLPRAGLRGKLASAIPFWALALWGPAEPRPACRRLFLRHRP